MDTPPQTPCQTNNHVRLDQVGPDDWHPDLWFADPNTRKGSLEDRQRNKAKAACFTDCPMAARRQCLMEGLRPENLGSDNWGIWGGYDEKQRQAIADEIARKKAFRNPKNQEE
jgi:hypothetical protein